VRLTRIKPGDELAFGQRFTQAGSLRELLRADREIAQFLICRVYFQADQQK